MINVRKESAEVKVSPAQAESKVVILPTAAAAPVPAPHRRRGRYPANVVPAHVLAARRREVAQAEPASSSAEETALEVLQRDTTQLGVYLHEGLRMVQQLRQRAGLQPLALA